MLGKNVDLNFPGRSMTLYRVSGCEKIPLPWTEPYTSITFRIARRNEVFLPVKINGEKLSAMAGADPKHVFAGAGAPSSRRYTRLSPLLSPSKRHQYCKLPGLRPGSSGRWPGVPVACCVIRCS